MLKIAICDSESQYAQELGRCIGTWAANAGYNVKVKTFSHGDLLLSCLQEKGMFDLIFLDIEKDTGSGLQTAARIRERDFITSIVFVSWYDYYKEAYEAHPFYFLHKPANPAKVGEILDAYMKMRYQDIETFTFGINKAQYNLRLNDIMYFYSERRHVNAVCKDRQYTFYGKLGEVQRRLVFADPPVFPGEYEICKRVPVQRVGDVHRGGAVYQQGKPEEDAGYPFTAAGIKNCLCGAAIQAVFLL